MQRILRAISHSCITILFLLATNSQVPAADSELAAKLKALPGVLEVSPISTNGPASEAFELTFEQPLDHQNPTGDKFHQRVFVSHVGYEKPVLLGTEGYAAGRPGGGELQRILGSNVVTVEH